MLQLIIHKHYPLLKVSVKEALRRVAEGAGATRGAGLRGVAGTAGVSRIWIWLLPLSTLGNVSIYLYYTVEVRKGFVTLKISITRPIFKRASLGLKNKSFLNMYECSFYSIILAKS